MFLDRTEAGIKLAAKLHKYENRAGVVVLGLPRGGVIVALEVAKELNVKLNVIVVRKIGAPGNEEFAIGAVTENGDIFIDENSATQACADDDYLSNQVVIAKNEAKRRVWEYRQKEKLPNFQNKTVILVDDGIATGHTIKAAIATVRKKKAKKIVVAVPVVSKDSLKQIEELVDEVVLLESPVLFLAVGGFYHNFDQISDQQVKSAINSFGGK